MAHRTHRLESLDSVRLNWYVGADHTYVVEGKDYRIWIQVTPPNSDRGRYIAEIVATGRARPMDENDGWPRYYYNLGFAMREIESWLFARNQE